MIVNDKTLSIVIPTIGRTLLDKTLESVFAQNVLPYEIVIWDNSGCGVAREQSKYKDDPALKWCVAQEKKDIISSWNCAVECTSGEYVYVLGDDDLLLPGFVEKVLYKLNSGVELIHTTAQIIDSSDDIIENEKTNSEMDLDMTEWEFMDNFFNNGVRIYLGSLVFPRASYDKIGGFKNIVMNALSMDILFHFELLLLHKKITVFAVPVWQYRSFVADWSGYLKSKEDISLLVRQYLQLREYLKTTGLIENKTYFKEFERTIIFTSLVRLPYLFSRWRGLMILFYKGFSLKERYYIARDLFYLIRNN